MNLLLDYPTIHKEMIIVEKVLLKNIKSKQPIITEATSELLNSGGKRLRPLLMVASAMLGKYDRQKITNLAAAIEMLHMATLIHDDIIDDSNVRRGTETVQSKWGKDIAVFTGDYLFCKSFLLLSEFADVEDTKRLAYAIKVICEGEIRQHQCRYKTDLSITGYLKRIASKTAILFKLSCHVGAYKACCSNKIIKAVSDFGSNIGMAFQITDDILDFEGSDDKMGKPALNDFTQGIYTLPIIYALNQDKYSDKLKKYISMNHYNNDIGIDINNDIDINIDINIYNSIDNDIGIDTDNNIEKVLSIVFESGGVEYSKQLAIKYIDRAQKSLDILPKGESRQVMQEILNNIIDRTN